MVNKEILDEIKKKCPKILDIRNTNGTIKVKIPSFSEEQGWIYLYQSPSACEEIVNRYLKLGYEIK